MSLDNLVDLIITCIEHPAAVGQVFLVSDGEDLSTTELLRRMDAPWRSCSPAACSRQLDRCSGESSEQAGICSPACAAHCKSISETRQVLGWTPPVGGPGIGENRPLFPGSPMMNLWLLLPAVAALFLLLTAGLRRYAVPAA